MDAIFVIRKRIIQGTTPRLTFQILDDQSPGQGFEPDTLVMSIYDVSRSSTITTVPATVTSAYVNSRQDVDVSASCDVNGNVDLTLETDDTDLSAAQVEQCTSKGISRRVLFQWTWDTTKHGAGIFDLFIFPTYKPT